jgi:outer membrane protein assembly factor BamA
MLVGRGPECARLSDLIEGVRESLKAQIVELLRKEHLEVLPSTPFQPAKGKRVETAVRRFLQAKRYPNAEVQLIERPRVSAVELLLEISPGPRLPVRQVIFEGNQVLPAGELRQEMRHTLPESLWDRRGAYTPEGLRADMESLDRHYKSKGYAQVSIRKPEIEVRSFQSRSRFPFPGRTHEHEGL